MEERVEVKRIKCEIEGYEDKYFEIGQKWETRGGDIVEITELDLEDDRYCIKHNSDLDTWVTRKGMESFEEETFLDLVKLIQEEAQEEFQEEASQPSPTVETNKLSDFLKENNAYDSFVSNAVEGLKWDSHFPHTIHIGSAFTWEKTKEGPAYWLNLKNLFRNLTTKEYDLTELIKGLVEKAKLESKNEEQPKQDLESNTQQDSQVEYYVFVQNKNPPKVAHSNLASAEREAMRLSEKEIGREVSIMCKVKSYKSRVIVEELSC